jgi:hypothetical protein
MKISVTLFAACLLLAQVALGQQVQGDEDNPASGSLRQFYEGPKRNIVRGAEKMPEGDYAFRPASEVRSFAQLVAHIAPAVEGICGWHPTKKTLVLWDVDQDGNVTESTLLAEASKVVYDEVIHGADGSALPVRAEALREGDDRFVFRASVEKDGSWPVVFEAVYSRAVAR